MAKGGIEHRQAQIIIRDYYKGMGKIAIVEGFVSGKHIDVLVQDLSKGKTIAVEYQTGTANALRNIFIDSQICDEVIVISSSQLVLNSIRGKAEKAFSAVQCDRMKFRLLNEFVPHERKKTTTNMAE